jgi:hypothetical protein
MNPTDPQEHNEQPHGPPVAPPPPPDAAEEEISYHLLGERPQKQNRSIFNLGVFGLAGISMYYVFAARVDDVLHLYLGLAILVLAVLPTLFWLRQGGNRFPVFEPVLLLCANAYALPVLNGHEALAIYPPETVTLAGFTVLVYELAAIGAYYLTRGSPGKGRFWRESVLTREVERLVSYGIVLSSAYFGIAYFTDWIPWEMESVLRAVFNGVSVLCTFITAQRWGRGELTASERGMFGTLFVVQLLIMCSTLLLIGAVTLSGIALLGYLSAGRKVPWVATAVLFAVIAVLHNGKDRMREIYWQEEERRSPTLLELPAFYSEWVGYGLRTPLFHGDGEKTSAAGRLLERTSLLHILCMVVDYTPSRTPYVYGETYAYVLPQLIPRFFWPDKPRSHVATYYLSVRYGLQDEDATQRTTIAFGMLAEAYANFGLLGALALGACFGFIYKKLQLLSAQSPMFSLAGLMMILLTTWSFNAELTLAAWVSSLFQALVAMLGLPVLLRSLFGF